MPAVFIVPRKKHFPGEPKKTGGNRPPLQSTPPSEQVFQRKLEDPRVQCGPNLAELHVTEARLDPSGPETVQHVVRFGAKLDVLTFMDTKYTRDGSIELPIRRQAKCDAAQISKRAPGRLSERRRVQ